MLDFGMRLKRKKKKRKIISNCNVPPKITMLNLIIRMKKKVWKFTLKSACAWYTLYFSSFG
jgi:hypothetical protein